MNILIVNDDSLSPGLDILVSTLKAYNYNPFVVIPDQNRSGSGASITVGKDLEISEHGDYTLCSGTPVDCVHVGLYLLDQKNIKPDLVISGVNIGPNLADDWLYSGTLCAAIEAARIGVRSVGISYCGDLKSAELNIKRLEKSICTILDNLGHLDHVTSLNIPDFENVPEDYEPEIEYAISHKRNHEFSIVESNGKLRIGSIGDFQTNNTWKTDNEVVESGNISLTSLSRMM